MGSLQMPSHCEKKCSNENIAQCLKITEKVAFNIASEASYVCILCGQKFIKYAKNGAFFENLKLVGATF